MKRPFIVTHLVIPLVSTASKAAGRPVLALFLGLAGLLAVPGGAGAGDTNPYPQKSVTLITHSSPGSGSDVMLRGLAPFIEQALGVETVVKNIRGGSGAKAMAALARSAADGSVFYATTPTFIYTSLLSSPEYRYTDVLPLVNLFRDPQVLYTAANSPFESLEQAIEVSRRTRGIWGVPSPSSLERQLAEQLAREVASNPTIVTHDGGSQLLINVLNGSVQLGIGEFQELEGQIEGGNIRILAVFENGRLAGWPEIPTVRESGYDIVAQKFRGLAAPPELPPGLIETWERTIQDVLEDPDYRAHYESLALVADFKNHDQTREFISRVSTDIEKFLRENGVIQ